MAEKRTINIDINNNAEETEKDFKNLNDTLDDTAKANDEVNKSFDKGATFAQRYGDELEPLTTRMGEAEDRLYELSLAGDTASKEYQELLKSVGNYRKTQIQTDLAVDQAANTFSQKLGGALTGATSGFAAVQGTMALVGTESEALEQTLLKVQGALALQQGVQGVLEYSKSIGLASKATKVFNLIVKANPLALLATAIIGIIGYFAVFTDAIDVAIDGLKGVGDFLGITNFKEEELAEERKKRHRQQFERQKAEQGLRDAEIKQLEALGKSTIKLRRQQVEADLAALKSSQDFFDAQFKFLAEIQGKEFKRSGVDIEKQAQIIALETQLIELDKEQETVNKANSEKAQARLEEEIKALEEKNRLRQEAIDKEIEEEIALQQTFDAIQRENEDRFRTEQENEVLLVEEKYDALQAMAFGNAEALEQIEIARLNELNDVKQKFADEEVKIEKKKTEEIKEVEEATQEQKIAAVKNTLSTIANLAELFAGESEREQKKAFKIQKAANIAQATIDTYASAVSSYNSLSGIPVVGPVLGGVAAAAAVTAGLLNIKSISQQEFGGGVGDQPAVPSDVGGGAQTPNFNVVGDSGVNQLAQLQQQPTQAYVVSGEVTTAQALDRNRVQNATL